MLTVVFWTAVVVSVIHDSDNSVDEHDYPWSSRLPNPSAPLILGSWLAFTAAGIAGYVLLRRQASNLALLLLAVYSGSGLVGIGHDAVPGATEMPWWRQAHVVADIACGAALLAFTLWAVRQRRAP